MCTMKKELSLEELDKATGGDIVYDHKSNDDDGNSFIDWILSWFD